MPQQRRATPKEVQEAAQQKDAEKGVGSIFDDVPKLIEQKDDKVMPTKVRAEVQFFYHTRVTSFMTIALGKAYEILDSLFQDFPEETQLAGKPDCRQAHRPCNFADGI